MSHSILITGGSGYLGGSLLAQLSNIELPPHKKLYALVRSKEQAEAIKRYQAEPLMLDLGDQERVFQTIVDAGISIIYFLVDAVKSELQIPMIKALGEVKKRTGQDVHFLHTSGAKMFSEHTGFPTDRTISDTDSKLYNLQESSKPHTDIMTQVCLLSLITTSIIGLPLFQSAQLLMANYNVLRIVPPYALIPEQALDTNNTIIKTAESYGVRSYIFIPCIVYGESEGFGNPISIQTTAVIKVAKKLRAVYDVNSEGAVRTFNIHSRFKSNSNYMNVRWLI
jgi:hypothetical protein